MQLSGLLIFRIMTCACLLGCFVIRPLVVSTSLYVLDGFLSHMLSDDFRFTRQGMNTWNLCSHAENASQVYELRKVSWYWPERIINICLLGVVCRLDNPSQYQKNYWLKLVTSAQSTQWTMFV